MEVVLLRQVTIGHQVKIVITKLGAFGCINILNMLKVRMPYLMFVLFGLFNHLSI